MRLIVVISFGILLLGVLGATKPNAAPAVAAQEATATAANDFATPELDAGSVDEIAPLLISVIGGDTGAVRGSDDRFHVVYELLLTNTTPGPATLQSVTVLNVDGAKILTLSGQDMY